MHQSAVSKKKVSFLRAAWQRLCRPAAVTRACTIEGLESRVVLSAGPVVTGVELLGRVTAIKAVVLTFNESLDPATAQSVASYAFGRPPAAPNNSSDFNIGDLFNPFRETNPLKRAPAKPRLIMFGKIIFTSAVYNDANHTVTLTPVAPFRAQTWMRYLRVTAMGPLAVEDINGVALNGGLTAVARWTAHPAKIYRYQDAAHNIVTFRLKGPGKLVIFRRVGKNSDPTIFIDGATSATIVTGTVTNRHVAAPVIDIAQFEGALRVRNNLLNNPSFNINVTTE